MFLEKHINSAHFLIVDLHGMYLKDAIIDVEEKLEECKDRGVEGLKIIHGYHHGTTLREYFQSNKFKEDMKCAGLIISLVHIKNLGDTQIGVEMQKLQKGKYRL